ncbi:MAG: hypothetical protein IPG34_10860 [Rhodocyclaceae bacterium]|nr:hypothetical protein [Rhodocyclaceae bacterium]
MIALQRRQIVLVSDGTQGVADQVAGFAALGGQGHGQPVVEAVGGDAGGVDKGGAFFGTCALAACLVVFDALDFALQVDDFVQRSDDAFGICRDDHERDARPRGRIQGVDRIACLECRPGLVGKFCLDGVVEVGEPRRGDLELAFEQCGIVAQAVEGGQCVLDRAFLDDAHARAVEGDHLVDAVLLEVFLAQDVEGRGQMTAQAVAGDGKALVVQRAALPVQFGVPRLHVGELTPGKAGVLEFEDVGRGVVAQGVVDEFGGAETEDEFMSFEILEQGAGEACRGIGALVKDFPFRGEVLSSGFR